MVTLTSQPLSCRLQVAEALPVRSQADVMQRELDSCLSLEFTPDSLPPLLHQVRTVQRFKDLKRVNLQENRMETRERPCKPFVYLSSVLYRQIISLGSDQISAHAEMEEILPPHQRH